MLHLIKDYLYILKHFSLSAVNILKCKNPKCNQSLVSEACIVEQSEATVSWLKPCTNYTFRIAAENLFDKQTNNNNYDAY